MGELPQRQFLECGQSQPFHMNVVSENPKSIVRFDFTHTKVNGTTSIRSKIRTYANSGQQQANSG
jgi:hypothetical protein